MFSVILKNTKSVSSSSISYLDCNLYIDNGKRDKFIFPIISIIALFLCQLLTGIVQCARACFSSQDLVEKRHYTINCCHRVFEERSLCQNLISMRHN